MLYISLNFSLFLLIFLPFLGIDNLENVSMRYQYPKVLGYRVLNIDIDPAVARSMSEHTNYNVFGLDLDLDLDLYPSPFSPGAVVHKQRDKRRSKVSTCRYRQSRSKRAEAKQWTKETAGPVGCDPSAQLGCGLYNDTHPAGSGQNEFTSAGMPRF